MDLLELRDLLGLATSYLSIQPSRWFLAKNEFSAALGPPLSLVHCLTLYPIAPPPFDYV